MKFLQGLAAVAVLAAPLIATAAPAEAKTAFQYQAQGHGVYVSSKARGYGWHRSWHRGGWSRHHWRNRHWRRHYRGY